MLILLNLGRVDFHKIRMNSELFQINNRSIITKTDIIYIENKIAKLNNDTNNILA